MNLPLATEPLSPLIGGIIVLLGGLIVLVDRMLRRLDRRPAEKLLWVAAVIQIVAGIYTYAQRREAAAHAMVPVAKAASRSACTRDETVVLPLRSVAPADDTLQARVPLRPDAALPVAGRSGCALPPTPATRFDPS